MGPKKTLTRTSRRQGTLWIVLMPMLLGQKTCDLCYVGLVRCRLPSPKGAEKNSQKDASYSTKEVNSCQSVAIKTILH